MGRDLDSVGCGQTTWKTVIPGLEADLSYYFEPEKVQVAKAALARRSADPADYSRPDLAIEIDMSPPQVDRPAIYTDLGVAEVWLLGSDLVISYYGGRKKGRNKGHH
jgi:Uma2 family endonuclease